MNKLRKALKADKKQPPPPPPQEQELNKNLELEEDNAAAADEDDDDFIMNEVKRRLKELRRNSFMVLIPEEEEEEEACPEDEDEDEEEEIEVGSGSASWRDVEEEGRRLWSCFGAFYDNYSHRMLFFDRKLLIAAGSHNPAPQPPRSTSPLGFGCLSLKKLQHPAAEYSEDDLIETSYVSQLCLTWEALHCQYTQLTTCQSQKSYYYYNHTAQQFQQFQVLLQRFIENEPFHPVGLRPQLYAQTRTAFPKLLLQVPNILGQEMTQEEESDMLVRAPDLIRIIESSILTFQTFIKTDKKTAKSSGVRNLFGQSHNHMATPLQQVQSALDKRKVKLKELWKKKRRKKNEWPATAEEVELLLGLIDVKVMSRVLRMVNISNDHLFWIEEKMKKLHLSAAAAAKLQRDPTPILFPC